MAAKTWKFISRGLLRKVRVGRKCVLPAAAQKCRGGVAKSRRPAPAFMRRRGWRSSFDVLPGLAYVQYLMDILLRCACSFCWKLPLYHYHAASKYIILCVKKSSLANFLRY